MTRRKRILVTVRLNPRSRASLIAIVAGINEEYTIRSLRQLEAAGDVRRVGCRSRGWRWEAVR